MVSANGIDPAFFVDGPNEPARFIYASHPFYGLATLLEAPYTHTHTTHTHTCTHTHTHRVCQRCTNCSEGYYAVVPCESDSDSVCRRVRAHARVCVRRVCRCVCVCGRGRRSPGRVCAALARPRLCHLVWPRSSD